MYRLALNSSRAVLLAALLVAGLSQITSVPGATALGESTPVTQVLASETDDGDSWGWG